MQREIRSNDFKLVFIPLGVYHARIARVDQEVDILLL